VVFKVVEYPSESWKQEQLQEALKGKDAMMKLGAIRVLQDSPKDEYVMTLIDALNDMDRLIRINAAITLGKAKNPVAVPALVFHAVSDQDKDVQLYSLWAYRQIDYAKASTQLVKILTESDNAAMVRFAANEIRQKTDTKSIDFLIQHFHSKGFYTGYDLDVNVVNALFEIGYATVEPLVKCLDSDDVRMQVNAVYALGKIGDERAIQPLINHLPAANIEMRSRISDALIKIGRASIPALIKLLDNKDRELKWIAAYSLGRIGPDAEAALINILKQHGPQASEEIIYALGVAGKTASFEPLFNIYTTTSDDSIKAWATISLASVMAHNYAEIADKKSADKFLAEVGEQLKPHMLLSYDTLHALGKIYIKKAIASDPEVYKANIALGVKCFDLSLIERENAVAKAYRLFYGSYFKLMSSKSSEIMTYIEKDITDMKKEAERSSNKKETVFLMDRLLQILQAAYADKNFNFAGKFEEFEGICETMEEFLEESPESADETRKLSAKELSAIHADIGIIQGKVDRMLPAFGDDPESAALAYRLSTELAKIDTGLYDDYSAIEVCLKNMVARMKVSNEEKSDLSFKILLVSKNGVQQIEMVVSQILKDLNVTEALTVKKESGLQKSQKSQKKTNEAKKLVGLKEYAAIAVLVILIVIVVVLALNKFGYIHLPYTFPVAWLNPAELVSAFLNAGIF
jgi:HEAT repeat protein